MEERVSKKGKLSRTTCRYMGMFATAVILAIIIIAFTGNNDTIYTPPITPVEIIKPEKRTILQSISLFAHIEALNTIPIIPLVSGTITDYPARAGTIVEEGEILTTIDRSPFEQQMFQARAAYEGYKSAFERIEQLYKANAASLQDFETVKAQRDGALAQLELAELQLGYAEVKSPVFGTILSAPSAKGNIASPTQPVAIVADLSNLVVRLDVSEKYFDLFIAQAENLFAYVTRSGASQDENPVRASIDTIAPYIQAQTKTFEVTFIVEDNTSYFTPGMFVDVDVVYAEHKDVYSLPLSVLKIDRSFYTFEVESENSDGMMGSVIWNSIPISVSDNNYFLVPSELHNSYFVLSGQNTVFDGQSVLANRSQSLGY